MQFRNGTHESTRTNGSSSQFDGVKIHWREIVTSFRKEAMQFELV